VQSRFLCGTRQKTQRDDTNKENDSPNDGRAGSIFPAAAQRGNVLTKFSLRPSVPPTAVQVTNNPFFSRPDILSRQKEHTTDVGNIDIPSASTSSPVASTPASTSTSTSTSSPEDMFSRRRRSRTKRIHHALSPDIFVQTDREGVDAALKTWFVHQSPAATLQVSNRDQIPFGGPLGGISEEEDVDTTVTKLEQEFDDVAAIMDRINSDPLGFPLYLIRAKEFY